MARQSRGVGYGWDSHKFVEACRSNIARDVFVRSDDDNILHGGKIAPKDDTGAVGVVLDVVDPCCVGIDVLLCIVFGMDSRATPKISRGESLHIITSNDAKVERTTFEGSEQVTVTCGVCVDDFATAC